MLLQIKRLLFIGQLADFLLVFEFQILQIQLVLLLGLVEGPHIVVLMWRRLVVLPDTFPSLDIVSWIGVHRVVLLFQIA